MHRWTARAAGGMSQRLKPGLATMRSRARKPGTATGDTSGRVGAGDGARPVGTLSVRHGTSDCTRLREVRDRLVTRSPGWVAVWSPGPVGDRSAAALGCPYGLRGE